MSEFRRESDNLAATLLGEFREFKEGYMRDRENTQEWRRAYGARLEKVETFVDSLRLPHKVVIWILTGSGAVAVGWFVKKGLDLVCSHVRLS